MTTEPGQRRYSHWTQPKSPGLLGLGQSGTYLMMGGGVLTIITLIVSNFLYAIAVAAILGGVLLAMAVRDRHGRNGISRVLTRAGWWNTRRSGGHLYRSGPTGRADWGKAQLPGLAAGSLLTEWKDSYLRPFALIQVNTAKGSDYTVVIGTEPDGAALVDPEQVDGWVADWGQWLSAIGDEAGIEAVSVTIETAPDTGTRLRRQVASTIHPDAPAFAQEVLGQIVDRYPAGSATVRAYVAITFSAALRAGGKKRTPDEMGRELASRLPGITQSLSATGAGATRPLSAQELCEVIRTAYDPAAAILIEEANAAGEPPELYWPEVGPMAHQANWDSYRHDSALSITWAMSDAPRGLVSEGILSRLLAPHREIDRKRVTLLYRPLDAGRAAAIVEADVRAASFLLQSMDKPTARAQSQTRHALITANEEASGAGLVNFGMLVTATVMDSSRAADAKAAIDNLSATARLRLRIVAGSQDSAFAAALPLGLVLPNHLQLPTVMQDLL